MVTVQPHVQSNVEKMIKFVQVPRVMMVAKFQAIVSQQKKPVQIMDQYARTIGAPKNAKKRRTRENVARRRWQKIVKKHVENAKTSRMNSDVNSRASTYTFFKFYYSKFSIDHLKKNNMSKINP